MGNRIGIDVGGTNVKIALVNDKGSIIYSNSIPTRAEMGYEYTINNMKEAIYDLLKETKTDGCSNRIYYGKRIWNSYKS